MVDTCMYCTWLSTKLLNNNTCVWAGNGTRHKASRQRQQVKLAGERTARAVTHRAQVRVEAAPHVADGPHQLRDDLLEPLGIHAPPAFATGLNLIPENSVRQLITLLKRRIHILLLILIFQWRETFCQRPRFDLQNGITKLHRIERARGKNKYDTLPPLRFTIGVHFTNTKFYKQEERNNNGGHLFMFLWETFLLFASLSNVRVGAFARLLVRFVPFQSTHTCLWLNYYFFILQNTILFDIFYEIWIETLVKKYFQK